MRKIMILALLSIFLIGCENSYMTGNPNSETEWCDAQYNDLFLHGHWTNITQAGNGLGVPVDVDSSNPQTKEIYTIVKIIKVN